MCIRGIVAALPGCFFLLLHRRPNPAAGHHDCVCDIDLDGFPAVFQLLLSMTVVRRCLLVSVDNLQNALNTPTIGTGTTRRSCQHTHPHFLDLHNLISPFLVLLSGLRQGSRPLRILLTQTGAFFRSNGSDSTVDSSPHSRGDTTRTHACTHPVLQIIVPHS